MERIDKIIASAGLFSRKDVKQLIRTGQILADGKTVLRPEEKYDPNTAEIHVQGKPLKYRRFSYLMLNKPKDCVSATEDRTERTVMDLLPSQYRRLQMFPVGRLDKDTEGLLLITNDGELAHRLLSPGKHVDKTYYLQADGILTEEDIRTFSGGITLKDGYQCKSAILKIQRIDPNTQTSEACITIQEGKYHQVKRMFAAIHKPVLYLKRLQMGPLKLDNALKPGEYRELTPEEELALEVTVPNS